MKIGTIVPDFEAETTYGPIKFYDWQGKSWVVIFSHPSDFTPVCTTELGKFAIHQSEFEKRNCKVLAHSVDKMRAHIEWVNDIRSYCAGIPVDFPYPIIADPTRELAIKLDMLPEDEKNDPETLNTIRSLYIISPDHKVHLAMYYPTSTGRNIDEILRCIDSIQLADRLKVISTPANWYPGMKVMILPEVSDEEAQKLFPDSVSTVTLPSGSTYIRTTNKY